MGDDDERFETRFSLLSRFAWGSSCAPFELWDAVQKKDGKHFVVKLLRTHDVKKDEVEDIIAETRINYPASLITVSECYHESEQFLYLLYEQPKHTMLSLSRFHANYTLAAPSLAKGTGARDSRLRFIVFQFLKCIHYLHSNDLSCDELHPANVCIDHSLWLKLFVNLQSSRAQASKQRQQQRRQQYLPIYRDPNCNKSIILQWIDGNISNFEYLMIINFAAGRSVDSMTYHPIIPWVTNFMCAEPTEENGAIRDLSKTKFRLSKGDRQLETTYLHSYPPHHLPESLSELTYCIYMARRIPLTVLRKIVRSEFVPEHYPHSMSRMYSWSPDECIPEFYCDAKVFRSIHRTDPVLNDIELPSFAPTAEEFIKFHRKILESDYVSAHLHKWIDLTFGCNLVGEAAIGNKNVPLQYSMSSREQMGGPPNLEKSTGFVVLFNRPHPKRLLPAFMTKKKMGDTIAAPDTPRDSMLPSETTIIDYDSRGHGNLNSCDPGLVSSDDLKEIHTMLLEQTLALDKEERSTFSQFSSKSSAATRKSGESPTSNSSSRHKGTSPDNKAGSPSLFGSSADGDINSALNCLNFSKKSSIPHLKQELAYLVNHYKTNEINENFIKDYGSYLQPSYLQHEEYNRDQEATMYEQVQTLYGQWSIDRDYINELRNLEQLCTHINEDSTVACEDQYAMNELQCEDVYSFALIVIELYTSRPILSELQSTSFPSMVRRVYTCSDSMPLTLKRILLLMLHPNRLIRPTAEEILTYCVHSSDVEKFNEKLFVKLSNAQDQQKKKFLSKRKDVLVRYCQDLFPSYFSSLYRILSAIKLHVNDSRSMMNSLIKHASSLKALPLEGISLLLPSMLDIIRDSSSFQDTSINQTSLSDKDFVHSYVFITDFFASRLGIDGTEGIIVPKILNFFQGLRSWLLIIYFLESNMWSTLLLRIGVKSFLKNFMPLLMNYLVCVKFRNLHVEYLDGDAGEMIPCWNEPNSEETWMSKLEIEQLRQIQKAASVAITMLSNPECLGPGLCTRYIIPSILCIVGVPQLVAPITHSDKSASYDPQEMFVVRTIVDLSHSVGMNACANIILSKIFKEILPHLCESLKNSFSPSMCGSFMEILFLLNGILTSVSFDVVKRFYVRPYESNSLSLASLLNKFPLVVYENNEPSSIPFAKKNEYDRRYIVSLELNRLITTTCYVIGPEITFEWVLPHIDAFFESFVHTYGELPLQREDFHKGLELASELVVPIIQLVGAEAFYTAVSHLNPRLELWLINKSSGQPCSSPPLPPSILPPASKGGIEMHSSPKKGIMSWLSTQWKSSSQSKSLASKEYERKRREKGNEENREIPMDEMTFYKGSTGSPSVAFQADNVPKKDEITTTADQFEGAHNDDLEFLVPQDDNVKSNEDENENDQNASLDHEDAAKYEKGEIDDIEYDNHNEVEKDHEHGNGHSVIRYEQFTNFEAGSEPMNPSWADTGSRNGSPSPTPDHNQPKQHVNHDRNNEVNGHYTYTARGHLGDLKGPSSFLSNIIESKTSRPVTKAQRRNSPSIMSVLSNNKGKEKVYEHENTSQDKKNAEAVWLLAGCDALNLSSLSSSSSVSRGQRNIQAAHVSMASPNVCVDVAIAASRKFRLNMKSLYSWQVSESLSIRHLAVHPTESLLLSSNKGRMHVWNLNSYPIESIGEYTRHSFAPYRVNFLRSGSQVASCDGSINLWDLETRKTIGHATSTKNRGPFVHMDVISPRVGIYPSLKPSGDDQVLACTHEDIYHLDFRAGTSHPLSCVSEWTLPRSSSFVISGDDRSFSERFAELASPSSGSVYYTTKLFPGHVSCSLSIEHYTIFGSNSGCIWVVDRRTSRTVCTCVAHYDCSIANIYRIGNNKLLSMTDKLAILWNFDNAQLKKIYEIKGPFDGITASNCVLGTYDESTRYSSDARLSYATCHNMDSLDYIMYAFSGHKVYSAPIPVQGCSDERLYSYENDTVKYNSGKEGEESNELKFTHQYLFDERNNKLSKSKLNITSAAMLPLRRMLIVGTEEGIIRTVV